MPLCPRLPDRQILSPFHLAGRKGGAAGAPAQEQASIAPDADMSDRPGRSGRCGCPAPSLANGVIQQARAADRPQENGTIITGAALR